MHTSLVFTHTPRTGGTFLGTAFGTAFPERAMIVDHAQLLPDLADVIAAGLAGGLLIRGHFTLGDLRALTVIDPAVTVNISSLRAPVARIASLRRFCNRYPSALGPLHAKTKDHDLAYFAQYVHDNHPLHGCNGMCYFLSGAHALAPARAALARDYDVVATNRRLADMVQAVAARIGRVAVLPPAPLNTTRADTDPPETISPATRTLIERLNADDMELHALVEERCDGLFVNAARDAKQG